MTSEEIKEMEGQITKTCEDIIKKSVNLYHDETQLLRKTSSNMEFLNSARKFNEVLKNSLIQASKQTQGLSTLQRKELESFDELNYSQYPVHPCVRSLYYISKIAENQQIKIIVPPTVLLGFGDDNRIMYNDPQTGMLVVKTGYISPKIINNFINKHMVKDQLQQSIHDRMQYPKFVIRLCQKQSQKNEIKIYYSKDSLIADLMSYWGSVDMALQIFVKQKHLRPYIYRYYMKNGNVYKAVAICNQENMTKESRLYQTILNLIKEWHIKQLQARQKAEVNKPKQEKDRSRSQNKKLELSTNSTHYKKSFQENGTNGLDEISLDQKGFPISLEVFKIHDYYSELQTLFSNSDFKKYFTCTTDFIENLTMMNCRPGVSAQAENMTLDLYRLFGSYFLKTRKYGQISQFVCDFIEGETGLVYLLQVKAFQCEGLLHDWQQPWSPTKTTINSARDDVNSCQAQIICNNEFFAEQFVDACKTADHWIFTRKKNLKVQQKVIDKYKKEIEIGKENFLLLSEKQKICPLYPLTTFFEGIKTPKWDSQRSKQSVNDKKGQLDQNTDVDNEIQQHFI